MALEEAFQTTIDEAAFAAAETVGDLVPGATGLVPGASQAPGAQPVPRTEGAGAREPIDFPAWNRSLPARAIRRASLPTWILPIARMFAWLEVEGREHLESLEGPVIFAANHQSHMDTPAILAALPARWRYRVAPAMAKEFFKAHFFPGAAHDTGVVHQQPQLLSVGAFLQRVPAAAARSRGTADLALHRRAARRRVLGADLSGRPADHGGGDRNLPARRRDDCVAAGRAGRTRSGSRGSTASCIRKPGWRRPGRARVAFGPPLRLSGDDYAGLARQVEEAVKRL